MDDKAEKQNTLEELVKPLEVEPLHIKPILYCNSSYEEDKKKIVNAVKACPWRVGVGNFFVCGCNNFLVCDIDRHTYSYMSFCPCMATMTLD